MMLRSMTGFGSGTATSGSETLTVELRSVNHKFCEVKARTPRELAAHEVLIQKVVKERLARGSIDVTVRRALRTSTGSVPTVDLALAHEFRKAFDTVGNALGLGDEVRLRDVIMQPGVVRLEEPQMNVEDAGKALELALATALEALVTMRTTEGTSLKADLSARLALVTHTVRELRELAPLVVDEYRVRLKERVAELARDITVDPQRLAQEVAIFAERTDVAEEMTRLASHLQQFEALLVSPEPSGRKMDFLVQEMHREVNTTGSKSQSVGISSRVVILKAELERIREQVQNIE